jgi:hypothetical protein
MIGNQKPFSETILLLVKKLHWFDQALESGCLEETQRDQCRKARVAIHEALQFIGQWGDVIFESLNDISATTAKANQGGEVNIHTFLNAIVRTVDHRKNIIEHISEQVQATAFRIDELSKGLPPLPKREEGAGSVT